MSTLEITEEDQAQIIANTGIALARFSHHAVERCEDRSITLMDVVEVLKRGKVKGKPKMRGHGLSVTVWLGCVKVVYGMNGTVISVVKYNPKEKKEYRAECLRIGRANR